MSQMENDQTLSTISGNDLQPIDLGELELGLSVYGAIAVLAAIISSFVTELVLEFFFPLEQSAFRFWLIAIVLWIIFNLPSFFNVRKLKQSQAPVNSRNNVARTFGSCVSGLFLIYAAFYTLFPFEGNASPADLRLFFGPLIAIFLLNRILLMLVFRETLWRNDYISLASSITALIVAICI